jgi:iron complex outermembrane recepter protein
MYRFPGGYTLSANGTLATLDLKNANPDNIPPFNTPKYRTNVMLGNSTIDHKWGFNVAWRWQDTFDWYGTFNQLRPGTIDAHSIVDAQVSYKLTNLKTIVKLGASNLFNNQVYEAYGSPTIGGIYYISLIFDQFLN